MTPLDQLTLKLGGDAADARAAHWNLVTAVVDRPDATADLDAVPGILATLGLRPEALRRDIAELTKQREVEAALASAESIAAAGSIVGRGGYRPKPPGSTESLDPTAADELAASQAVAAGEAAVRATVGSTADAASEAD